jgi:hypothetical protein
MVRALISAVAVTAALSGVASAQSCEEGIAFLDNLLQDSEPAPQADAGPSRQSGDVAAEQPQFGNPVEEESSTAPSPAEKEPGTVPPQEGDPAATGSTGPSGQTGQVAEEQPQFGADDAESAPERPEIAGPLTGGSDAAEELADSLADLTSGERRRLVELRDDAMENAAAGREAECLDVLRQAEKILTSSDQQN